MLNTDINVAQFLHCYLTSAYSFVKKYCIYAYIYMYTSQLKRVYDESRHLFWRLIYTLVSYIDHSFQISRFDSHYGGDLWALLSDDISRVSWGQCHCSRLSTVDLHQVAVARSISHSELPHIVKQVRSWVMTVHLHNPSQNTLFWGRRPS